MRAVLLLLLVIVIIVGAVGGAPTAAPSAAADGPLEPCVKRIELHRIQMSRVLLTVAIVAFFLGVCLCSCVVCCLWCIASRVNYSVDEGFTNTFDGLGIVDRIRHLGDRYARDDENPRGDDEHPRRAPRSRVAYTRVAARDTEMPARGPPDQGKKNKPVGRRRRGGDPGAVVAPPANDDDDDVGEVASSV